MGRETELYETREGVELHTIKKFGDEDMAVQLRQVDLNAGLLRELLVPPGAGVELTYAEKQREALQFIALNPSPEDYGEYPFLASDASVDGVTVADAAVSVLFRAEVFRTVGPVIEAMRRGARKALLVERNPAAVRAIVKGVDLPALVENLLALGMTPEQLAELQNGAR